MKSTRVIRYLFLGLLVLAIPASSFAGVFISVGIAPPALPVYVQPACPGDGYIWTPGYWAYGPEGYYWVPGTWVMAPEPGLLWTPGYWGWGEGAYVWHAGYWGPHIGFYGGINYGFGYFGTGYEGGYWRDRHFFYNRSVNNVTITNVHIYNRTVNNVTVNRIAYNGGHGGINARPSHFEEVAVREHHLNQPVCRWSMSTGPEAIVHSWHPRTTVVPPLQRRRGRESSTVTAEEVKIGVEVLIVPPKIAGGTIALQKTVACRVQKTLLAMCSGGRCHVRKDTATEVPSRCTTKLVQCLGRKWIQGRVPADREGRMAVNARVHLVRKKSLIQTTDASVSHTSRKPGRRANQGALRTE